MPCLLCWHFNISNLELSFLGQAVSNPEMTAKRKLRKNLGKADAKKRKTEEFRTSRIIKRRKREAANLDGFS